MAVVLVLTREREAAALTRWAVHFARGRRTSLHIISAKDGSDSGFQTESVDLQTDRATIWKPVEEALLEMGLRANRAVVEEAAEDDVAVTVRAVQHTTAVEAAMHYIDEAKTGLLMVGHQHAARTQSAPVARLAQDLFEAAPCPALLLRLGNHKGDHCRSVLVPTSKDPNVKSALRLGHTLTQHSGSLTALNVEPPVGWEARQLGEQTLTQKLAEAGVEVEDGRVETKVILSNNVSQAIAREAEMGEHDLVLLGAAKGSGIRKRLFGTVPDRLLKRPGGMAVAVIRGALPATEVLRRRLDRWISFRVPQLDREERVALFEKLQLGSKLSRDFLTLISLSTAIAAFGLVQSSPAVVIGAMLVAPLMTPLLGAGLALVQGNLPMIRTCFYSILVGFLLALCIGLGTGYLAHFFSGMTPELQARGAPNLLDLGVALFSGIAASYCLARPGLSSALAGVAIAAALVPPIATVGIAPSLGAPQVALGAAILFFTNVATIILGSAVTFYLVGIRGALAQRSTLWFRRLSLGLCLAITILSIPLTQSAFSTAVDHGLRSLLDEVVQSPQRITAMEITKGPKTNEMVITVDSPNELTEKLAQELSQTATMHLKKPTTVRLREHRIVIAKPADAESQSP